MNAINVSFKLPGTETETDTGTAEKGIEQSGNLHRSVSKQYEHLHAIQSKRFLWVSISALVSDSVKGRN